MTVSNDCLSCPTSETLICSIIYVDENNFSTINDDIKNILT